MMSLRARIWTCSLAGAMLFGVVALIGLRHRALAPQAPNKTLASAEISGRRVLPGGRVVSVISVKAYTIDSTPVLEVRYQTAHEVRGSRALAEEVQALWPTFVPQAERQAIAEIAIWAVGPALESAFTAKKDASGKWACERCEAELRLYAAPRPR